MKHGNIINNKALEIIEKINQGIRLAADEVMELFFLDVSTLSLLAQKVKKRHSGDMVYFNRNLHIEPTNVCIYHCRFCSYKVGNKEKPWLLEEDEIIQRVLPLAEEITELHITGGVHPNYSLEQGESLLIRLHQNFPLIHLKAFTSTEIAQMCKISGVSVSEGLRRLKQAGLASLPGGGAEIFDKKIREQICPDKPDSEEWLAIHEAAHKIGLKSNATMLYGHIEKPEHRVDHLLRLRELQDRTMGFNAFIPLKFRRSGNAMSDIEEISSMDIMKNYAISRIVLDNIPHLKAYWPSIGRQVAQMSLAFGVDDLDGTINDSTSIYTRAGAEENRPEMSVDELCTLIRSAGFKPVERNSLYQTLQCYE